MDSILEKISQINTIRNFLSENEQKYFDHKIINELENIDCIISDIYNKLSEIHFSEQILTDIELDNKRQKIIWKILFPQYWTLTQTINNSSIDDLNAIADCLKNNQ